MPLSIKKPGELKKKLGQVIYVAGVQWGDEGKGKLVDILGEHYDIIARSAGGANAGHTIWIKKDGKSEKFVFHLIPSGVLHEGKICLIGSGTVIHVPTLLEEMASLKKQGIVFEKRLLISDRAHLIFGYHKLIDEIQEDRKGADKVGTTKRGIGPAYADKAARIGLRMGDLRDFSSFSKKLRENAQRHMKAYGFEFNIEEEISYYNDVAELLNLHIINATEYINDAIEEGKTVLVEGAQGTYLDLDQGNYPFVTSSSTVSGGACASLGIAPNKFTNVIGIMKAYTTRVGSGPFPTELGNFEGDMLREVGGEFGATTGRPRRCGWFDVVVAKNAITLNGITSLNLTKLDVLSKFKTIKVATGYKLDGQEVRYIPSLASDYARVEVEYQEFPGWEKDIAHAKTLKDLPKNAQAYVLALEKMLKTPINFIGVGTHREEMIIR